MAGTLFILPGMLGSSLYVPGSELALLETSFKVWYRPVHLGIYGPDYMDLAADGQGKGPLAPYNLSVVTDQRDLLPDTLTYHTIVAYMKQSKQWDNVQFLPYDWRHSIIDIAKEIGLSFYVANMQPPFYVLAYSFGGLVARALYALLLSQGNPAPWTRTVYVNVPHGGSYEAARALTNNCSKQFVGNEFLDACGVVIRRASHPLTSFSSLDERCKQVIASWPSMYELLPNVQATYGDLDPYARQLFQQGNYRLWNSHVTQARLDSALATQKYLEGLLTLKRPDEINFVGSGRPTATRLLDFLQINSDKGYISTKDGDTVVPSARQTLPGATTVASIYSHDSTLWNSDALKVIFDALVNGVTTDETIPVVPPSPGRILEPTIPPLIPVVPPQPLIQTRGDP